MIPDTLPGLNVVALEGWLRREHPKMLAGSPLSARRIVGGLSNLSYRIDGGMSPWVLRRPPLGHVLSTAHDMGREFRVMSALSGTAVPVPRTHVLRDDSSGSAGVGAQFYLMDFVEGKTLNGREDNAMYARDAISQLGPELARVLARLHEVDLAAVGLADFGRPAGFLTRQVGRWTRQLEKSRSRDLPTLDRLQLLVSSSVPASASSSLVHGDYRLDNTLVAQQAPQVLAVLDWEMSTLGDPLTDLGLLGVYWDLHEVPGATESPLASAIDPAVGYVSFDAIVDTYSSERGIPVPDLSWYVAFGAFKLAVVLEGIHYRYTLGQTVGDGFDTIGRLVPGVTEVGLRRLGKTRS
ncbi:phosphotransferase family protein [Microbacterium esteraromaticum]|uniref:phosphotransferase family protein n=1 Tax=Microbacterium esteraromaticum TaxID=57043 RepID=UPI001C953832|nr:phosphotransferase family protein [Microbacterium esteraromaticum]MBY6061000.1 phosphotransferase family protein [Microbacterium esteraromaticum]